MHPVCEFCGERHSADGFEMSCAKCGVETNQYIQSDLGIVCKECSLGMTACGYCETLSERTKRIGEKEVCPKCVKSLFRVCTECEALVHRGDLFAIDSRIYCQECVKKVCDVCSDCDSFVLKADVNVVEDEPLCKRCYSKLGRYREWHHTKARKFYGGDKGKAVFYGVEIEVDGGEQEERDVYAKKILDLCGRFVECKRDGSVASGMEVVSQPATLEHHAGKAPWPEILNTLSAGWRCHNNCGLHVHASRDQTSTSDQIKIASFVNLQPAEHRRFGRRRNDQYAGFRSQKMLREDMMHSHTGAKYEAVNMGLPATIEWRFFKGTLVLEEFLAAIEYCEALIKFVKTTPSPRFVKRKGLWDEFMVYCDENGFARVRRHYLGGAEIKEVM